MFHRMRFCVVALAVALVVPAIQSRAAEKDIVDTAVAAGSFNTLVAAVKAAGLVEALKGEGPLTVFAPTDEAFAALPEGTVEALLKDKEKLTAILTYHVVAGKVTAADVVKLSKAKTLQGSNVRIKVADGGVKINGANVIKADIMTSNGVIHVIDRVILPPERKASSAKPAKSDACPAAGKGSGSACGGVGSASIEWVPAFFTAAPACSAKKDIVDTAVAAGSFNTLVAAVKAAGLVEALKGEGPLTVFAPTDEAFAALPEGTVEALLKDEEKLASILTYHVVAGRVTAADVVKLTSATTLQGAAVTISASADGVKINDANVVKTDIFCSNGVIHVIDRVILPPTE